MIENIDYFYRNAGQYEKVDCRTCGSSCSVERDRPGATVEVYAWKLSQGQKPGNKDKHDRFICPHAYEDWHVKATNLRKDIAASNSPSLKEIMEKDLQKIVEKQTVEIERI